MSPRMQMLYTEKTYDRFRKCWNLETRQPKGPGNANLYIPYVLQRKNSSENPCAK